MRHLFFPILVLFSVQVYAQTLDIMELTSPLLYPRSYNGSAALGNDVVTAGGLVGGNITATAEINVEILSDNDWTEAASMLEGRTDFAMIGLDANYAIAAGGWNGMMNLTSTELYDKVVDEWSAGPALSEGRSYLTATKMLDGKIAFIGGYNGTNDVATVDIYDPITHAMTTASPMNYARSSHVAVLLESGYILVAGGFNPAYNFQMTQCEIYNPFLDQWTEVAPLNNGRDNFDGVLTGDGRVLVTGGRYYDGVLNLFLGHSVAEFYDPDTDEWTTTDLGIARHYHRMFSVTNELYGAIGGVTQSGTGVDPIYSDGQFWTGAWTSAGSLPRANFSVASVQTPNSFVCFFIGGDAEGTGRVDYVQGGLNIEEGEITKFTTFPNPVVDRMTIVSNEPVKWDVYSLNGQLVLSGSGKWVDCQTLSTGTYTLVIRGDSATETKTFQRL